LKESRATVEQLLHKIIQDNRFSVQTISGIEIIKRDDVLLFEYLKKEHKSLKCRLHVSPDSPKLKISSRFYKKVKEALEVL
jgi:hypothetical protein